MPKLPKNLQTARKASERICFVSSKVGGLSLGLNKHSEVILARIVLTWFYWSHSRYAFVPHVDLVHLPVPSSHTQMGRGNIFQRHISSSKLTGVFEVFVTSAHALRLAVPLGLNILPPFQSITNALRPASILPPARTVVEEEMRRNAFWLAYANERLHGFGNGWALSMDDNDVCQLLPLRGDQFDQGVRVRTQERQLAHVSLILFFRSRCRRQNVNGLRVKIFS